MIDISVMLALYAGFAACGMIALRFMTRRAAPSRPIRWLLRLLVLFAATIPALFLVRPLARSRTWQVAGALAARVDTDSPFVALTFDDGPTPEFTEEVLRVLSANNVKATFFLTGNEITRNPQQARAIGSAGHEVGNHTWSHARMIGRTGTTMRHEIERTDEAIRSAGYGGPILFRPPYGIKLVGLPLFLSRRDRVSVTWDVEPDSYREVYATSDGIVDHTVQRAGSGSIILLHVMYPSRATSMAAVAPLIWNLQNRGYRLVTVSQLLASRTR